MIDEFQDTSGMQWRNFFPLVRDSLSSGNKNLIVGDVKQSIYRWRNSDGKLLEEQLDTEFRYNGINHQSLDTNWRSLPNIIHFNNAFFKVAPDLLQIQYNSNSIEAMPETYDTKIKRAYAESYQYIPKEKGNPDESGHIYIEFIDTEEHSDWQAHVLEQLPHTIESLQDKGYRLKDIAILVRTKKEGADVANRLLEYKGQYRQSQYRYDIISDEALYIKNSKSIKLVISLFRYLHHPADPALRALAVYEYYKFKNRLTSEEAIRAHFTADAQFPQEILNELNRIRELPLYEMAEEIFNLFQGAMNKNENIYIQSFLDMILDFMVKKSSDLDAFLQWWDETGQNQSIYTSDGQDAIRIMTIHKSKGLDFEAVIIPFCKWEIDHKLPVILWCQPHIKPFNQLKLVPVKYSKNLQNTIFAYEYFDEKLHAYIDSLNILYVAFTRAKSELIIYSPRPSKNEAGIVSTSSLLWAALSCSIEDKEGKDYVNLSRSMNEETGIFELGKSRILKKKDGSKTNEGDATLDAIPSIPFGNRLKLKLNNKYFFTEKGRREYGTLMHEIISNISSPSDLPKTVEAYRLSGEITEQEQQEITALLSGYLANPQIAEWYSPEYTALNEIQILCPDATIARPDRVIIKNGEAIVIDYKFGEKEEKKYHKQVEHYMSLIRQMGYSSVKGYICYITLGIITEVKTAKTE
jgi:ATP-dependent exoDNAse (exonuclease V) beta subunit